MDLAQLFQLNVLLPWFLGMIFGIFVGSTPGLTATMAVALIVPIGYGLEPTAGIALVIGVSFTAIFAGDIPATYLRIPGTPASATATLDGYPLAQQGKGTLALLVDLLCSSLGGLVGVGLLIAIAPQLARFAVRYFTHFEYFWLGVAGLLLGALMTPGSRLKGLLAALLGVLLSTVGSESISNAQRFTFGRLQLIGGLDFIAVMIGLFGMGEVIRNVVGGVPAPKADRHADRFPWLAAWGMVWQQKWTFVKSSVLGTLVGALPGAGADIAAWCAYGLAQNFSRRPEKFGTGCAEGVVAPTSANNAAVAGAWIPALVFGIPGDSVTAIVLGAFTVFGIKTDPKAFTESGGMIQMIFLIALLTQIWLIPAGLIGIRAFTVILKLPKPVILAAVMVFSIVGSYSLNNQLFDVWVMVAAGIVGYLLELQRVPLPPLILGLMLGQRTIEENLRNGLIRSEGDFLAFFQRPASLVLVALIASILAISLISPIRQTFARRESNKRN